MSVININCLHGMLMLPDNSVDAIVTDTPYGLSAQSSADVAECLRNWTAGDVYEHGKSGFMGRKWDSFVPGPEIWRESRGVALEVEWATAAGIPVGYMEGGL